MISWDPKSKMQTTQGEFQSSHLNLSHAAFMHYYRATGGKSLITSESNPGKSLSRFKVLDNLMTSCSSRLWTDSRLAPAASAQVKGVALLWVGLNETTDCCVCRPPSSVGNTLTTGKNHIQPLFIQHKLSL